MDVLNKFVNDGIDRLDRQAVAIKLIALLLFFGCHHLTLHERLEPEHILNSHPTYQNEQFPLIDYNGVVHRYRDNFDKLVFPRHNEKLTQYCSVHYDWENIKAVWSRDKVQGHYRWNYYVSKHKMSHKMRKR